MTTADRHTGRARAPARRAVAGLRSAYQAHPRATGAALFAVLAATRLAGAYSPALLVLGLAITPAVLLAGSPAVLCAAGITRPTRWADLLRGGAVVVAAYVATVGACVLLLGTGPDNWASALLTVFTELAPAGMPGRGVVVALVAVASLGVLVPIAEEVCYRGLLLHAAAQRHRTATAVAVTSAAWSLVHLGDYGLNPFDPRMALGMVLSVFVMGLALGWCRVRTGSAVGSAIAQGVANLMLAAWVLTW